MNWPTIGIVSFGVFLVWIFTMMWPKEKSPSDSYIAELRKAKALREANKGLTDGY